MKFVVTPLVFVLAALIIIGLIHGDLWIAFKRFSAVRDEATVACLFAVFAGFFVALLKD
ncbi:MAG: hypothetical protein L0387_37045 [Acidobacteria bacterium]|nr:hypothetical protein [Acidobacteriota bacterium]MCI0627196.1 hypothetical protein [Acidobacteriota bacterium]MCI0720932.1 hypothetical protein [Acidobacteriota bacterium]